MHVSRRFFLKQLAAVASLLGGTQLAGCLGGGSSESAQAAPPDAAPQAAAAAPAAPAAPPSQGSAPPAPSNPPAPSQPSTTPMNSGPVWQSAPTIEFVEGVPAVVSVREFVRDPDSDPLVIALKSGALIPGIVWDPTKATISYDGRPLGAQPDTPVVVTGITFTADDGKI
jgi:hypothetical protein